MLLSHGLQVMTSACHNGEMTARIVNSPRFQQDNYFSNMALRYAYHHHLKNDYKDEPSCVVEVNNKRVPRSNHAFAHTDRVEEYIDLGIDYFALYARDEEFRDYCKAMSPTEREWLRIAAVFRVTGREGECSESDSPERYNAYKEASSNHFKTFMNEDVVKGLFEKDQGLLRFFKEQSSKEERSVCFFKPGNQDKNDKIDHIAFVIRYLGKRDFETHINVSTETQPVSNEVIAYRNHLFRILNTAHNLDLPRDFSSEKFESVMDDINALVLESDEQKQAIKHLVMYAMDLTTAHGDTLRCRYSTNGELESCSQDYAPPFDEVSHSFKRAREISALVPKPEFLAPTVDDAVDCQMG